MFSHYDYYDKMIEDVLKGQYIEHLRESWVRILHSWVPYPFQNNIRYLPNQEKWECVRGLLPGERSEDKPNNFLEWIHSIFGKGIAKHFMEPYNYKVWATRPENMSFSWIGERVSVVDLRSVLKIYFLSRISFHGVRTTNSNSRLKAEPEPFLKSWRKLFPITLNMIPMWLSLIRRLKLLPTPKVIHMNMNTCSIPAHRYSRFPLAGCPFHTTYQRSPSP